MLISIVTPVYNIENYITKCIESIQHQTYTNYELILVDDGSTDESGKICDAYAANDSRIKVIHKENGGLVSARKIGAKMATGEYILSIDGDDYIDVNTLNKLVNEIEGNDYSAIQFGLLFVDDDGNELKRDAFEDCIYLSTDRTMIIEKWMENDCLINSSIVNKLIKTNLFRECYCKVPDEHSFGEDQIHFIQLISKMNKIKSITDCFYFYRIRSESLSHTNNKVDLVVKENLLFSYLYEGVKDLFENIKNDSINTWYYKILSDKYMESLLKQGIGFSKYQYYNTDCLRNKRIIVYGSGQIGSSYIEYISKYEDIEIVCWVDNNSDDYSYDYRKVFPVSRILEVTFDYIVIAIKNCKIVDSVRMNLIEQYYIDKDKIVWVEPKNLLE